MASVPTDYIIPLKQLNVAGYMAQLNALYGQAERYKNLVTPGLPGMPDIPQMIKDYLARLLDELLQKLREKLIELLTLLMAKAAQALIPVINTVIMVLNAVVDIVNNVITGLFPYARVVFQVMVVCSVVYIVGKIVCEVIPDFGAGMGAVTVFTTPIKNVLKFLSDAAIWLYQFLKPVAYAILSAMRMLLKYFAFLNVIMGFINMLKMFTARDYAATSNDFTNTADSWNENTDDETPTAGNLVECTLPDGSVQSMTPEDCEAAGGTYDGMDLLAQYADISNQIVLHNSGVLGECLEGAQCRHLNKEECLLQPDYCTWSELYDGDEIVDCLLPDGEIEQLSPQECLDAGGTILTSEMLQQLLEQQDLIASELNQMGLGDTMLNESLISSLLNPNPEVTVEDVTKEEGVRYGFYGEQFGSVELKDELDAPIPSNQGNNMMKKGGKIKSKPKRKNK